MVIKYTNKLNLRKIKKKVFFYNIIQKFKQKRNILIFV